MAAFHSGKYGTAYCGTTTASVELPTISWSVNETGEVVTFRNSKTGRFTVAEETFAGATITVNYDYDYSANPFLAANGGVNIVSGATNALRLYVGGNSTPTNSAFWDFPTAVCQNISQTMAMESKVQTTATWLAAGTFIEPAT